MVLAFVEFSVLRGVILLAVVEQMVIFVICSQVSNMSPLLI